MGRLSAKRRCGAAATGAMRVRGGRLATASAAALVLFVGGVLVWPSAVSAQAGRSEATLERWIRVLVDGDPFSSAEAEQVLYKARRRARPLLERRLLVTHSRRGRRRVARLLGRMGDRRAATALKAFLAQERDDERSRLEVAVALLRLGDAAGIPVLIELMASEDRSVRLGAQIWFGRYTHRDFGYRFDAAGGERKRALERIRTWWETVRERFFLRRP